MIESFTITRTIFEIAVLKAIIRYTKKTGRNVEALKLVGNQLVVIHAPRSATENRGGP